MPDGNSPSYLILGATGGIGSELSQRLASSGARLTLAARDEGKLTSLADRLGGDVETMSIDATDPKDVGRAVARASERFGSLDGAVNLVGSLLLKPSHLTTDEEWADTIAANLNTAFFLLRASVKEMLKSGGSVVLMSTVATRIGLGNHEAIAAAKSGINGLVISAAASYAPRGIRVNAVAPGLTRTPLTERLTSNEVSLKASTELHPMGRIGEPADIASAIAWLLDPAQSWVTGQVLGVDGGLSTVRSRS